MNIDEETILLLGLALYISQRFEFGLYGIVSHMSHLPEAKRDKRFSELTPDDFLSSDPKMKACLKVTLGQICKQFGERLLLSGEELEECVANRNLIVHNFYREVNPIRGAAGMPNPNGFLRQFVVTGMRYNAAMQGLLSHLVESAAIKEGRLEEFSMTDKDIENRNNFESIVSKRLTNSSIEPA